MRRPSVAVLVLLVCCVVRSARAEERFTIEASLGAGAGLTGTDVSGRFGIAPIGVTLGTFVYDTLAVGVRLSGTVYVGDPTVGNSVAAIAVQPWVSGRVFLEGGIGIAILHPDLGALGKTEQGFGVALRAGYVFARSGRHAFSIVVETYPSFYSSRTVLGATLAVQWQLL